MWSIGVMTYKLLSGQLPFTGATEEEVMLKILKSRYQFKAGSVWDKISEPAKAFIAALLVSDSGRRFTAGQALEHPWLAQCDQLPSEPLGTQMADSTSSVHLLRALPHSENDLVVKARLRPGEFAKCLLADVLPPKVDILRHDVPMHVALRLLADKRLVAAPVATDTGGFLGFVNALSLLRSACASPPNQRLTTAEGQEGNQE